MLFQVIGLMVITLTMAAAGLGYLLGGWQAALVAGAAVIFIAVLWQLVAALIGKIEWKRECGSALRLAGMVIDTTWVDLFGREQHGSVDLADVCAIGYSIGADGKCVIVHFYRMRGRGRSERQVHTGWFPAQRLRHSGPDVYGVILHLVEAGALSPRGDVLEVLRGVMRPRTSEHAVGA